MSIHVLILKELFGVAAEGLVVGMAASFALMRALHSLLYGIGTTDPLVFIIAVAVFIFAAMIAVAVPAQSAARVDPMTALRYE